MLYMPMADEIPNYEWSASNCYSWTPWLNFVVDLIESAACVDIGSMLETSTKVNYIDTSTQKRRINAFREKLAPEARKEFDLIQSWLNR